MANLVINKDLLVEFLLKDNFSTESLEEVKKVVKIVIAKYYSSYFRIFEDLVSQCVLNILERRSNYDPSYSAYNYIYTIARNTITNYINRQKEVLCEDIFLNENLCMEGSLEVPRELSKFLRVLVGEEEFTVLELDKKDAINLILFHDLVHHPRKCKVPEFLQDNSNLWILYRLLLKL